MAGGERAPRLGANCLRDGSCEFLVWAPRAGEVRVRVVAPLERTAVLERQGGGYHRATVPGIAPGTLYFFTLDNAKDRPDPASRLQPQGVHGPSEVVDSTFPWQDADWRGLPLEQYILYELHTGTFTPAGTFEAIIPRLDALADLGITAIEFMPVAQFPGSHNWGYDGVYPFAVQSSYGGPRGLKTLINACHARGMAVVLDVVYNHLGPEGNYLADFGPYFTDRYRTPWGAAINFDGPESDEVRRFFIENALERVREFHADALRLDAIHGIVDTSPRTFLEELGEAIHREAERLGRCVYVIPESDRNDPRVIRPREAGGYGLDAVWNDDFHHALHALLARERAGYYQDFGTLEHLRRAFAEGFVYSGQYSAYHRRRHGNSSLDIPASRFVVFSQNHDQTGNRPMGERLSGLVSYEALKLAAGAVLFSPFLPLLFMGEEYGESAPFQYFISHLDPSLVEAVRRGRQAELAAFGWQGEAPDPHDEATFLRSKLHWEKRFEGKHAALLAFYREAIRLRREIPALTHLSKDNQEVIAEGKDDVLCLLRRHGPSQVLLAYHFKEDTGDTNLPIPSGRWRKRLDSAEERWRGPGSGVADEVSSSGAVRLPLKPSSVLVFERIDGRPG
jgi:maltooligosyltrehalose trehalohydrolase